MKVSVIIPTYNRSKLISAAIESVLAQSINDHEIIVIDDGSTDDTREVLKKFNNKIRYLYQENKGLNVARNVGIREATGEYIALLDSDDLWLDFKLELQIELLDKNPDIAFVFSDFFIFGEGKNIRKKGLQTWHSPPHNWEQLFPNYITKPAVKSNFTEVEFPKSFNVHTGNIYDISLSYPIVLPSTALVRHSIIKNNIEFYEHDSKCGTDWFYFAQLSNLHNCIYIDLETTLNRSHEDEVRLTRVDPKVRMSMWLDMIHHTWEKNPDYMSKNSSKVYEVKLSLHNKIIKHTLKQGDYESAKQSIIEIEKLNIEKRRARLFILKLIVCIPGSHVVYRMLRSSLHFVKRMKLGVFIL